MPKCDACERGDIPQMMDVDGTLCAVSGRLGKLKHAFDDYYWVCRSGKFNPTTAYAALKKQEAKKYEDFVKAMK